MPRNEPLMAVGTQHLDPHAFASLSAVAKHQIMARQTYCRYQLTWLRDHDVAVGDLFLQFKQFYLEYQTRGIDPLIKTWDSFVEWLARQGGREQYLDRL